MTIPMIQVVPAKTRKTLSVLALTGLCAVILSLPASAQQLAGSAVRGQVTLNGYWGYILNQSQNTIPTSGYINARIPEQPLVTGNSSVWYQRTLNVPSTWAQSGRSFFIELERAGHYSAVYVNGQKMGEHFGQFSPFEVDVTSAIVAGQTNTINVYVHKADTTYVRANYNLNQSSCPISNPDCMGNAYRGSAPNAAQRNWVGLVGDITFSWRPTEHVTDVFPITSVRNWTLTSQVSVTDATSNATVQETVLDGSTPVLTLPPATVVSGVATLEVPWTTPVLWGPAPYGQAKLYMLQTQLLESGVVVDTIYTKFGFRETWDVGKTTYLNGIPLWSAGNFFLKLAPVQYVNDRRAQAFQLWVLQQTGFNMIESHWDTAGRPLLDMADEMGMLVVGSFYCDGRPIGESEVDSVSGWTNWMSSTATSWTQEVRHHPSIIFWRPTDVLPGGVNQSQAWPPIDAAVRAADPSARVVADGTDMDTWVENIETGQNVCDNGNAFVQKLAGETKPLFVREIAGKLNEPCVPAFFNTFYQEAYQGGSNGLLLALPATANQNFVPKWFSISGQGNRPTNPQAMPNWNTQQFLPTSVGTQFATLYETYFQPTLLNTSPTSGDYQAVALPPGVQSAFLVPLDGDANPVGVIVAEDGSGTAWFVTPQPGNYALNYTSNGQDVVQNVTVSAPAPF